MSEIPQSVWSGTFTIFGVEVKCHCLDDGSRIIEADSMEELMEAMEAPDEPLGDIEAFMRWNDGGATQH